MGLLFSEGSENVRQKMEISSLHKLQCQACRLNKEQGGNIPPTGATNPLVYVLGEAPGRDEVFEQAQFVGDAGKLLRTLLPESLIPKIRWNNCVRSRPPKNRTPEWDELECCRPSVQGDIERSKPKFIFGFGSVPLEWVSGFSGITLWRGRRMPVLVGNHPCWYYAFFHPSFLLRNARNHKGDFGSENERMTSLDIQRALAEMETLPPPDPHTPERAKSNVESLTDLRAIEQALTWAAREPLVGIDYETTRLRPYEKGARILSAGVGTLDHAFAFPVHWSGYTIQQRTDVATLWKRFLLNAPCTKAVHNLTFEMEWSAYFFGEEVLRARPWEDTANAAAILDERRGKHKPGCFSLEFLVQQHFGLNLKKISQMSTKTLGQHATLDQILHYNGMDAKYHAGLWQKQWPEIVNSGLQGTYKLARRSVPALVLAQLRGLLINQRTVEALGKKWGALVAAAERKVMGLDVIRQFEKERGEFNPYSQPNLLYVFDKILRRPEVNIVDKYTKEKKKSVAEDVLVRIDHPLSPAILDLRDVAHNKTAFIDPLKDNGAAASVIHADGLVHATFNGYFAETGRLSAEGPNVQQWPKRDAATRETRRPFVAPPGHVILAFDYGQIEARVIAMFTRDERFCKALWERYDIHKDWAERIAYEYPNRVGGKKNLKDKKAMRDFRTDIKNQWTFPLVYGARMESAAAYLNIPVNIIRPLFDTFWKEFSGIADWQAKNLKFYSKHGYTECLTGRRRRGPLTINQLHNAPIQGTAAEIIRDSMCRLSEKNNPLLQFELQIHDDLTFTRIPADRVDEAAELIITEMLAVPFDWVNVPISVEMSWGKNWCDMEDAGNYSSDTWFK
jgi:uracil-DNA glycosylase family 4